MLDPWIIEEIRRREEREKLHQDQERRPVLEIPLEAPRSDDRDRDKRPSDERGVVIINFGL